MRPDSEPSLAAALAPLAFLALALAGSLVLFGEDASYGPNQIALMLAGCVALLAGRRGRPWRELEREVFDSMGIVFAPAFILLAVGVMIAMWTAGGIVPAMIWYGLQVLDPAIFYAATCLVCAVVSLAIGSSWTTAASVGVALMGTASGLGMSPAITAGAVISGAYFGDKMSPLSDTTNLAPAVAEADLFDHIRHMSWTGVPALGAALLLFLGLGLNRTGVDAAPADALAATLADLERAFTLHPLMLLPLAVLFVLAWRRMPAFPAILLAAALGAVYALVFQPGILRELGGGEDLAALLEGLWTLSFAGYEADTGNAVLNELLGGGGAASMLEILWLILAAVFFGGAMERTGLLSLLVRHALRRVRSTGGMITATVLSCIGANLVTGDQYIAIVLPGRMYKAAFRERGLAPVNLSRALEDSATVTSALVPWNSCGAFMAATLGVATLTYLPWCFFNLLMPLISIGYGLANFRILPLQGDLALSSLPSGGNI